MFKQDISLAQSTPFKFMLILLLFTYDDFKAVSLASPLIFGGSEVRDSETEQTWHCCVIPDGILYLSEPKLSNLKAGLINEYHKQVVTDQGRWWTERS